MSDPLEHSAHLSTELGSTSPRTWWTDQYAQSCPGVWEAAQPRRWGDGGSDPGSAVDLQGHICPCLSFPTAKLVNAKDPLCSSLK